MDLYRKIAGQLDRSPPVVIPTIETKRLILRPFRDSDISLYFSFVADPQVMRFVGTGEPLDADEAWRQVAFVLGHWQLRGYGQWAVEEKSTGQFVGRVGLHHPHGWPGLEVGWLIDPSRWGEGFAAEGGHASLRFAFHERAADQVISVIQPQNAASIRVAEKIGERFLREDEVRDKQVVIYGIDRDRWLADNLVH